MSKHVGEKCGKWADGDWSDGESNLICSTSTEIKVMCKISAQYVKASCRRKVQKMGGRRQDGLRDVRQKCGILSISGILCYKRGITPTESDGN